MRLPFRRSAARTLLIPNQWNGSVQEFYHFLLGYFIPVYLWAHKHPHGLVTLRDCGPMNQWLDLLPADLDRRIVSPGDMLHLFAQGHKPRTILTGLDNPTRLNPSALSKFRNDFLSNLGLLNGPQATKVTIVDRRSSGTFNKFPEAEVPASGAAVRSTPNLERLTLELFTDAPKDLWSLVDPAQISPVAQVAIFRETKLLIGQHGAGLTNMLWMDQGGTVVEVLPPRPAHDPPFFLNLARACGHRYFSIDQRDDHADIEESRFQTTVRKALRECQILW